MTVIDSPQSIALGDLYNHRNTELGQFFTPPHIARFMSGLLSSGNGSIRLLDPGAGIGALSTAFLERLSDEGYEEAVELTAYEIDPTLLPHLAHRIETAGRGLPVESTIIPADFIESAVEQLQFNPHRRYSHVILNPPYRKIGASSRQRRLLRQVGIETVNLYAGFVALSIALIEPGGQLVAITPRSFCNGTYFRSFRDYLLGSCALQHIHLFEARDRAFREDKVLQENVIFLLTKGAMQGKVTISYSTDDTFSDYIAFDYPFNRIVLEADPERFIHVPALPSADSLPQSPAFHHSLDSLDIQVSTGPVVDFRVSGQLKAQPEADCAPLFYPHHFVGGRVNWPRADSKKPNALMINQFTRRLLYPNGYYVVVRRVSSKEEKRRIVAGLLEPDERYGPFLGFENHLNVFHQDKNGLPKAVVRGLAIYLNSTTVDRAFRRFSGHTQVNATDLRNIGYPCLEALRSLGERPLEWPPTQDEIDSLIESVA